MVDFPEFREERKEKQIGEVSRSEFQILISYPIHVSILCVLEINPIPLDKSKVLHK